MKSFTHCPVCNESLAESGMGCECARTDRLANFLRLLNERTETQCTQEDFAAWEAASDEALLNFEASLQG